MINNRYFILPNPNPNAAIWDIVVEKSDTARENKNGTKLIVKLPEGDEQDHPLLNGFPEYNHAGILNVINNSPEWQPNEI